MISFNKDSIWFYFRRSAYMHLLLVAIAVLTSYFLTSTRYNETEKINLALIESSVRVDMVAMPKITLQELKHIKISEQVPEPVEEEIVEEQPSQETSEIEFKKVTKKKNFLSMLKKYSKRKIKLEKTKTKKKGKKKKKYKLSRKQRSELSGLLLAGNKLSQGQSLTGSSSTVASSDLHKYVAQLPDWIKPRWKLPSYLKDKGYKCGIRIYLSASGELLKATLYESSGNQDYDSIALKAVKQSAPYPRLPETIKVHGLQGKIILGFPL